MSFRVLYAPHPPQFTLDLTAEQFARCDARFADLRALRARGALGLAVQDSADLLGAHLILREGEGEWRGTPGVLDEGGAGGPPLPFREWSEAELERRLGMDLGQPRVREVDSARLGAELLSWPVGTVYIFLSDEGAPHPGLARRLNLASFFDRLEVEFLARGGFEGVAAVRACRLTGDGTHEVLRAHPHPVSWGKVPFPAP
ncbi:hypothetical protein DAERI_070017 [Deinococcus aerius]|uniref:Uncharacterized protein n=1 Tax=Deinococcus aerius TaxID=200253 RepID=A0A2I9CVN8_9DEIO|nr:hypothetical protein [Deinococcus aerius]GBF06019.1 hypothetical protein DAERI_070017 [Deinococcus aerius]